MDRVEQFAIDTSKEIKFQAKVSDGQQTTNVNCGIWKATIDNNYIFCDIDETLPKGSYTLDLSNIPQFDYQNYKVTIQPYGQFTFEKLDMDMLDLYSEQQTTNIASDIDSYDIKFKIISYHQEVLKTKFFIINCDQNNNELVCHFPKNELEKSLYREEMEMPIYYIGYFQREAELPLVPDIIVKDHTILEKTDVYILITKLVTSIAEDEALIAYETNVTDISSVYTGFDKNELEFENEEGETRTYTCTFTKYDTFPLYIVCFAKLEGISWLKEITEEKTYLDISIKYNFRIQPVKNRDKINFTSSGRGSFIIWTYPQILNFTKNDTLYIYYSNESPRRFNGITFNENAEDLSCEILENKLKRCVVPKSHFEGKESGYYFTKHTNHLDSKSINYEVDPVYVFLDDPEESEESGESEGADYPEESEGSDEPEESDTPERSEESERSDYPEESEGSDEPYESDIPDESDESDDPGNNSKGIMYSIPLYYSLLLILIII